MSPKEDEEEEEERPGDWDCSEGGSMNMGVPVSTNTTGIIIATTNIDAMANDGDRTYSTAHKMGDTVCPPAKHTRLAPVMLPMFPGAYVSAMVLMRV